MSRSFKIVECNDCGFWFWCFGKKKNRFFLSLYFNVKLYILIKGPLALTIWTKDFIYEKNFFSDK